MPPIKENGSFYVLSCDQHIITGSVIPYLSIIIAYIGAFYIFRIAECEHLSSLSETVSEQYALSNLAGLYIIYSYPFSLGIS